MHFVLFQEFKTRHKMKTKFLEFMENKKKYICIK